MEGICLNGNAARVYGAHGVYDGMPICWPISGVVGVLTAPPRRRVVVVVFVIGLDGADHAERGARANGRVLLSDDFSLRSFR